MARKYQLKRRAERQEETRRRIALAAMALHESVGPAQTTISAIAERAGVQRLTVYRHFPDEASLFRACSERYFTAHPLPDPGGWAGIEDPVERLETALRQLYAYYRSTEAMTLNVLRDLPAKPELAESVGAMEQALAGMRRMLCVGWDAPDGMRAVLEGAVGHALDFSTWYSLARRQGMADAGAVRLMVTMVTCVAADQGSEGGPPSA